MFTLFAFLFLAAFTPITFFAFWKANPGLRFWWLKTPTSHAALFGAIAYFMLYFFRGQEWSTYLYEFAAILLIASWFGYLALLFANHPAMQRHRNIRLILIELTAHQILGFLGFLLFLETSQEQFSLTAIVLGILYFAFLGNRFLSRKFPVEYPKHERSDS